MRVEVIKAYGSYSVGHVFTDMPGNQARTLIGRGLVREYPTEIVEAAPIDRMMRPAKRTAKRLLGSTASLLDPR